MTSMPASRNARAITLAPRSCPSSPGLATSTRILASAIANHLTTEATEDHREWDCDSSATWFLRPFHSCAGVILRGAVLQAERRILRGLPPPSGCKVHHHPDCPT